MSGSISTNYDNDAVLCVCVSGTGKGVRIHFRLDCKQPQCLCSAPGFS